MKSTGIVRKVDELGRVVLPKELRDILNIAEKDPLEIFVEDGAIILQKYQPGCVFCSDIGNLKVLHGKGVCKKCIRELKQPSSSAGATTPRGNLLNGVKGSWKDGRYKNH
jgi:transcriptional pleiotropic regulator of transition state genes